VNKSVKFILSWIGGTLVGLAVALAIFISLDAEAMIVVTPSISHAFKLASKGDYAVRLALFDRVRRRHDRYALIESQQQRENPDIRVVSIICLSRIVQYDLDEGKRPFVTENLQHIESALGTAERGLPTQREHASELRKFILANGISIK
jgi:hypothetical protein